MSDIEPQECQCRKMWLAIDADTFNRLHLCTVEPRCESCTSADQTIASLKEAISGLLELFGNYGFADESPCERDREIIARATSVIKGLPFEPTDLSKHQRLLAEKDQAIAELRDSAEAFQSMAYSKDQAISSLQSKLRVARSVLGKLAVTYAGHLRGCSIRTVLDATECNCGFTETLEALKATEDSIQELKKTLLHSPAGGNEKDSVSAAQRETVTPTSEISDGYHTFGELYDHRITLYIALCRWVQQFGTADVWRSRKHSDGSSFDGWFVLGIFSRKGLQITYHLPNARWQECDFANYLAVAPEFDGHTSNDVLERLKRL